MVRCVFKREGLKLLHSYLFAEPPVSRGSERLADRDYSIEIEDLVDEFPTLAGR